MKIECHGYIENGELVILNRKWMDAAIKQAKNQDVVIVIKKRGKRTNQANRYYWGVIIDELRRKFLEMGERFTPEEIHEGMKAKFNPKSVGDKGTGEALFIAGDSTTEMNKQEFGEYIEQIIQWAATHLQLTIPPPNTQTTMFTGFNQKAA